MKIFINPQASTAAPLKLGNVRNFTLHFTMDEISHPCWVNIIHLNKSDPLLVRRPFWCLCSTSSRWVTVCSRLTWHLCPSLYSTPCHSPPCCCRLVFNVWHKYVVGMFTARDELSKCVVVKLEIHSGLSSLKFPVYGAIIKHGIAGISRD